ncbi:MAG: DNA polymerase III subunit alpha, partial [Desulfofustis sp.]|nr:DNA polymerase III subunit alpha [Desulfofustis sp.]
NGFYSSLVDFCNRVDSRRVNNRVIESLIKSGSFDSLGGKRSQLTAILPKAMDQAKAHQRDRLSGQLSLFSVGPQTTAAGMTDILLPDMEEWDERQKLIFEKDTVGFYITGHPLDNTLQEIRTITDCDIANLDNFNEGQPVRVGGLIRSCKQLKSKRGEPMAFVTLEDILEAVEVMVFPETYTSCRHLLNTPDPVIIRGTVQKSERGVKIIAEEIDLLVDARVKYTEAVHARLTADSVTRIRLDELKQILFSYHGSCPFSITIYFPGEGEVDVEINRDFTVRPCRELSERVHTLFGYDPLSFRKKTVEAPVKRRNRVPS